MLMWPDIYGKHIQAHTGKPVGLMNTNWGGTPVEFCPISFHSHITIHFIFCFQFMHLTEPTVHLCSREVPMGDI